MCRLVILLLLTLILLPIHHHTAEATPTTQISQGGKIVFTSNRDGNQEIYVMNADGSNQENLSRSFSEDWEPVWSPDGTRIAFTSTRDGNEEIYIMNADGSNVVNLTNHPAADNSPSWSPDGREVTFASLRTRGDWEIYIATVDGSDVHQVTTDQLTKTDPVFSANGQQLLYWALVDDVQEIHAITREGTFPRVLMSSGSQDGWPRWSPDGRLVAFDTFRDGNWEVYLMDGNGDFQRNISKNRADDARPSWSPDGRQLLFTTNRDGNNEIYLMDADGSNLINLTNNVADDNSAHWLPRREPPAGIVTANDTAFSVQNSQWMGLTDVSTANQTLKFRVVDVNDWPIFGANVTAISDSSGLTLIADAPDYLPQIRTYSPEELGLGVTTLRLERHHDAPQMRTSLALIQHIYRLNNQTPGWQFLNGACTTLGEFLSTTLGTVDPSRHILVVLASPSPNSISDTLLYDTALQRVSQLPCRTLLGQDAVSIIYNDQTMLVLPATPNGGFGSIAYGTVLSGNTSNGLSGVTVNSAEISHTTLPGGWYYLVNVPSGLVQINAAQIGHYSASLQTNIPPTSTEWIPPISLSSVKPRPNCVGDCAPFISIFDNILPVVGDRLVPANASNFRVNGSGGFESLPSGLSCVDEGDRQVCELQLTWPDAEGYLPEIVEGQYPIANGQFLRVFVTQATDENAARDIFNDIYFLSTCGLTDFAEDPENAALSGDRFNCPGSDYGEFFTGRLEDEELAFNRFLVAWVDRYVLAAQIQGVPKEFDPELLLNTMAESAFALRKRAEVGLYLGTTTTRGEVSEIEIETAPYRMVNCDDLLNWDQSNKWRHFSFLQWYGPINYRGRSVVYFSYPDPSSDADVVYLDEVSSICGSLNLLGSR